MYNEKPEKALKYSSNVVQIHANPYERFSKYLLNLSAKMRKPVKVAEERNSARSIKQKAAVQVNDKAMKGGTKNILIKFS